MGNACVKVLYHLSEKGQKAFLLAGRACQPAQEMDILHGDALYERAVAIAHVQSNGHAVIDSGNYFGCKMWDYLPEAEEVLAVPEERQKKFDEKEVVLEAQKATATEALVQECLAKGPEAFVETSSCHGTTFRQLGGDDVRLVELKKEAKEIIKGRRDQEKAEREARLEKTRLQAEQEESDRVAWIETHGSIRLRRMLKEDIEHQATYRDERLEKDYPGWSWAKNLEGEHDEPRNPPEKAFVLLDEARKKAPKAKLVYWTVNEEDITVPSLRRQYVVAAYFLGEEIVYGYNREG